ncbi:MULTISPECIES: hypothetical protein [unclassified Erwinia]|uniref:hypothetical protein n=1 Tax=unclassified Erwinia TaxID=2622719 RepID=UPI0013044D12|nr:MULTISPECIES: hypothetical protein [unclassified Erwinia]
MRIVLLIRRRRAGKQRRWLFTDCHQMNEKLAPYEHIASVNRFILLPQKQPRLLPPASGLNQREI